MTDPHEVYRRFHEQCSTEDGVSEVEHVAMAQAMAEWIARLEAKIQECDPMLCEGWDGSTWCAWCGVDEGEVHEAGCLWRTVKEAQER